MTETDQFLGRVRQFCEIGGKAAELGEALVTDIHKMTADLNAGILPDCPTDTLVAAITKVLYTTERLRALGVRDTGDQN